MGGGVHLSVRVPWHDSGWSGSVCRDPLANASCVLLKNVSGRRHDDYEVANAGRPLNEVDVSRIGCMTERGSFLSPHSYELTQEHPYRFNPTLRGLLRPTPVTVPAYGVHATPYFWLHRANVEDVRQEFDVDYRDELEEFVDRELNYKPAWVLHGDNQRTLIERFFADVDVGSALVFFYAKHSPFDGSRTGGPLLVGAARITDVELPGRWETSGPVPFPNHMWETSVRHSLRPDGTDGILLPVAELARMEARGEEVADALAWAPEHGGREFAYVTERVSDDTAIATLERLFHAAQRCQALGLDVPDHSLQWLSDRIGEMWSMRGPAPGLGAVLGAVGFPYGAVLARAIARHAPDDTDPWDILTGAIARPDRYPDEISRGITATPRKVWATFSDIQRRVLRLLSRFQLTTEQARALFASDGIDLTPEELIEDPYLAYICMVGTASPVAFDVVDRGCFPQAGIRARFPMEEPSAMTDGADARRVQALVVWVLEEAALAGDTLMPLREVIRTIEERRLAEGCPLTEQTFVAHGLHPTRVSYDPESPDWPPLLGTELADGTPAFKLARLETTARVIRRAFDTQLSRPRAVPPDDLADNLAQALPSMVDDDPAELRARQEKKVALAELFAAPLSVLNGRAGTGKTTLVKALVSRAEVKGKGVLLLAPTGKARVQLQTKVGQGYEAQTLAQFLSKYQRYDGATGTYLTRGGQPRAPRVGTVVVDECSMLTEEQLAALLDVLIPPDRLILIGDPRQLPPIGAGRPFVDLITRLTARVKPPRFPRVAGGYAELTELRRQQGEVRDDLMLATWFSGDEIPQGFDEVWQRLRTGRDMDSLAAIPWGATRHSEVIDKGLAQELDVAGPEAPGRFETSYGGRRDGPWMKFPTGEGGAAKMSEAWQILTPTRGHAWGTVEINRHLKRSYRRRALSAALKRRYERTVPQPIGAEQIVLGDKVLNNRNMRSGGWPRKTGLDYVANGEIGVVVGAIGKRGKPPQWTNVEFSSQIGVTYGYRGDDEDDPALELAWAITIHKSQGSEFDTVFVVLPGSARRLSREMLYTALTRQQKRVVLLHERPIDELLELTRSTGSETAHRLTDLFVRPDPKPVRFADGTEAGMLDANLVHVTADGTLVRSKNEVIVAGILDTVAPGLWTYEQPLSLNGQTRYPDFTIVSPDGRTIYWEHLGMLDNPHYEAAWRHKERWYSEGGILPYDQGGGPHGTLIHTDDRAGVNVAAWTELAGQVIGPVVPGPRTEPTKRTRKTPPGKHK